MIFENQEKSIKKLNDVPCGDQFPTCMFIKDSHRDKSLIHSQRRLIENLFDEIKNIKTEIRQIEDKNVNEKIEKYEKILSEEQSLKHTIESSIREISLLNETIKSNNERVSILEKQLPSMRLNLIDNEEAKEIDNIKISIRKIEKQVKEKEQEIFQIERQIGSINEQVNQLKLDKENYETIRHKWRIYNQLISAYGKNGIPLMVLSSELPKINNELAKILREVAGFTIELESPDNSNSLDIVINYGDSKRPIELGSGMEKMMASLAIRVALINISSLPKSDILIIDEGFGALDENNIEACNRLLSSLKRYFKSILVISHVDAVKDSVDFMIEINSNGKDSNVRFE
jgi:exonuclease SbcC